MSLTFHNDLHVQLKTDSEILKIRESGKVVNEVLNTVQEACVPGVTTWELNEIAVKILNRTNSRSAFLGYKPKPGVSPFPAVLCTSVNNVVVHGIPDKTTVLKDGDIISLDFACYRNDYCADAAVTIGVGTISTEARKLIETTKISLSIAIDQCYLNKRLGDLGFAVEQCAKSGGYSVVRDYFGHGIGKKMHELPNVFNYGKSGFGLRMSEGLVLAIEPILNEGSEDTNLLSDNWSVVTKDGKLSAHVEHTVAITKDGPQILTLE